MARSTIIASCATAIPAAASRPTAIASRRCTSGAATASAYAEHAARHVRHRPARPRGARSVVLARDPFGIKPLYTAEIAGGIAFASEPQALIAAGLVTARLRPAARDELLQLQFTTGAETIFEGIAAGPARRDDRRRRWRHRSSAAAAPRCPRAGRRASPRTRRWPGSTRRWRTASTLHQRSDVPYGMFLSGGIDSATVLAMMARLNERPVLAFTAGFDVPGAADERARPRALARRVGARHETSGRPRRWSGGICRRSSPPWTTRPPTTPSSRPGSWRRRRAAGREGGAVRRGRRRAVRRLRPLSRGDAARGGWAAGDARRAAASTGWTCCATPPTGWRDGIAAAEAAAAAAGPDPAAGGAGADVADWLPNDLLLKLDRCLMAHGVEGRTPLLDPGVAAAAFRAARCAEGARRHRQMAAAAMAGAHLPGGPALRAEAGLHRAGRRLDRRARATGSARWCGAARRRRDRPAGPGRRRCSAMPAARSTAASPRGTCCSTRCGTAGISRGGAAEGDVFEALAAR